MSKMKIAITGGIGSGKSTVLQYIKDMGYPVFSCDEIYKEVIETKTYIEAVQNRFPSVVIDGKIQRKDLSDIVFHNPAALAVLNKIAHPLIMKELLKQMQACDNEIVFAEVPLLFEGEFEALFDKVIILKRDNQERISSVQKRDGLTSTEVEQRINVQFDHFSNENLPRIKKCNAIILENNNLSKMKDDLNHIISQFL